MTKSKNPRYPFFIPSKGRWDIDRRLTSKYLDFMGVPYRIIVEPQEADNYIREVGKDKVLVMDMAYKTNYELCDNLGLTKSTGPGPARNFAWDVAIDEGAEWHWVADDNINNFLRLTNNLKIKMGDGSCFRAMEDFCERYENVTMAGPNYRSFASQNSAMPPFITNTRIYSCNLIKNDAKWITGPRTGQPFRWRGRYNEDTIISLDMMTQGFCTIQFNAFLQDKVRTQVVGGGNTAEFYSGEGTAPKSRMLKEVYPKYTDLVWKFGREHHHVDYLPFKSMELKLKPGVNIPDVDPYNLTLKRLKAGTDNIYQDADINNIFDK
jgi:hypothetical protein